MATTRHPDILANRAPSLSATSDHPGHVEPERPKLLTVDETGMRLVEAAAQLGARTRGTAGLVAVHEGRKAFFREDAVEKFIESTFVEP